MVFYIMSIFLKTLRLAFVIVLFFLFNNNHAFANIENIAKEIVKGLPNNLVIGIQPLDRKQSNISMTSANGIIETFTNEIQRALAGTSSSLIDRSKLETIMLEQEEFQNIEEFSGLIENTGTDVLIGISLNRENASQVGISARAFGVKGNISGQVLSASKTYLLELPQSFAVQISSIKQGQKDRNKYLSSFLNGLSNYREIEIVSGNVANHQIDYDINISIEFDISERETEESKQAAGQAQGLAVFNSIASGMMKSGKKNPFAGLAQSTDNSEDLKQLAFISNSEAKIVKLSNKTELYSAADAETTVPINASDADKKKNAAKSLKDALYLLGQDVGMKITGTKSSNNSGGDLLD